MATKSIRMSDGSNTLLPESAVSGSGYCKFADGTLMQWGTLTIASGTYIGTATLPVSFVDTDYKIGTTSLETGIVPNISGAKSTSSFILGRTPNTSANNFDWIAIGRWK